MHLAKTTWIFIIATIIGLSISSCFAETVYKSTDKNGNVTFSDKPVPGAANAKTITIKPQNPAKEQRRVQQLERQLSAAGSKPINPVAAKRKRLQQRLKRAYATLGVTQAALARAKATANQQFKACLNRAAQASNSIICKTNDLSPLQALVAESQAKVATIKTQIDNLPR